MELTITTALVGVLDTCVINAELFTPSQQEVIVWDSVDLDGIASNLRTSQVVNGLSVKEMSEDRRNAVTSLWRLVAAKRRPL